MFSLRVVVPFVPLWLASAVHPPPSPGETATSTHEPVALQDRTPPSSPATVPEGAKCRSKARSTADPWWSMRVESKVQFPSGNHQRGSAPAGRPGAW